MSYSFPAVAIRCRGLLFDNDGILISSIASVERAWTQWALLQKLDPTQVLEVVHGRRGIECVQHFRPDLDAARELRGIEDIEMKDTADIEVLPGVLPLLSSLPEKYWTVVTSASDRLARVRFAAAKTPLPARIITGDDVVNGKPHAEPYQKGAELLGFSPEECIVFEDSPSGVRAGKAAGCSVIATTFSHSAASLSGADWIVKSLEDVRVKTLPEDQGLELELAPVE